MATELQAGPFLKNQNLFWSFKNNHCCCLYYLNFLIIVIFRYTDLGLKIKTCFEVVKTVNRCLFYWNFLIIVLFTIFGYAFHEKNQNLFWNFKKYWSLFILFTFSNHCYLRFSGTHFKWSVTHAVKELFRVANLSKKPFLGNLKKPYLATNLKETVFRWLYLQATFSVPYRSRIWVTNLSGCVSRATKKPYLGD